MIACISIIGPQNNPLFLQTYDNSSPENHLKFHYIVHCSLDSIEERVAATRRAGNAVSQDAYLGLLHQVEEYRLYGYAPANGVRFIAVVQEPVTKDDMMWRAFKRLHSAYADAVSNPFYTFGMPLTSSTFEEAVASLVEAYSRPLPASGGFQT
mmetsp:Transcript_33757/g.60944  ORF Transcript_33757/g.60944 Transcript_33757/m.60944 type:complete len:153 (-) Transcript_33757:285-743(-)|eukprot:CAMPEP_0175063160 /NCGR_PEP_ID=MMETSP0052_2-20121109/14591_1 /TAXON_ID=51329 ORGANISM="Polytomella parva, Strain SAG 63-3" /NCGR_SAMPLE_ID=MMETSP0052_2 /ASSEMBLY_ACC=CAM_ASM_000194 /LENGTH=152 /DNA_ID=CAMNT_0016329305 /DNA_START=81 /DNA_END=539 /DNA_ORIENTATION=+